MLWDEPVTSLSYAHTDSRLTRSENRLTALPVELRALRKLHTLNLANNELQARGQGALQTD